MSRRASSKRGAPTIVNRRARHDYEILGSYEAGIVLEGSEVKSVLNGEVSLAGGFCRVMDGELWLMDVDIAPYEMSSPPRPDRRRTRKLLMHKREIELLRRRSEERGLTLIPTKVYYRGRRVKVEVSLARALRKYDKRRQIAEKEARREAEKHARR
ncbi:MAG: SsrA-binding protein SmpB [Armatimonadetes bacterium]|nr:SsrA-binding protein SmpB [Armatimonadota bacterium]